MLEKTSNFVYNQIKEILITARSKAYSAVNFAMVEAYWLIGKQIVEVQGNNERAEYGTQLLKYLSESLTQDFGKGFDESNLRYIRQYYLTFPIRDAVRPELRWSPVGIMLCADKREAVVRYTLPEGNEQIFAPKYMLYLSTTQGVKKSPKDLYVNNPVQTKCSTGSKRNSGDRHLIPVELRSSSTHWSADVSSAILAAVQPTTGLRSQVPPQP